MRSNQEQAPRASTRGHTSPAAADHGPRGRAVVAGASKRLKSRRPLKVVETSPCLDAAVVDTPKGVDHTLSVFGHNGSENHPTCAEDGPGVLRGPGLPISDIAGPEAGENHPPIARSRRPQASAHIPGRKDVENHSATAESGGCEVSGLQISDSTGQEAGENHYVPARRRRGRKTSAPVAVVESAPEDDVTAVIAGGTAKVIAAIVGLQRRRRFCIRAQGTCDRAIEAFIAAVLRSWGDPEIADDVKAGFAKAKALRMALEPRKPGAKATKTVVTARERAAFARVVEVSARSRIVWDVLRETTETQMVALVDHLPGRSFQKSVKGFGEIGFAKIIGETGDLSGYATKERVWKRLGLAVIDGVRQQKMSGKDAAAAHGYNPVRRAEVWNVADSLFRQQWTGDRDADGVQCTKSKKDVAVHAHAVGPYGVVYGARKAHVVAKNDAGGYVDRALAAAESARRQGRTPAPENVAGRLTGKHVDNDARRVMTKALVADLWRAWTDDVG